MKTSDCIRCVDFPCSDIDTAGHLIPGREIDLAGVRVVMISEAPPADSAEYFYAPGDPAYMQTTLQAFDEAGQPVSTVDDILSLDVYLTTAIKCAKIGYGIQTATIQNCSMLLEQELALFPDARVYMLMGDVAIKALNAIARRAGAPRVIPAGSTYKIRAGEFWHGDIRVFPSYAQTGKNYLIEKSKRRMIAEDIRAAMAFLAG